MSTPNPTNLAAPASPAPVASTEPAPAAAPATQTPPAATPQPSANPNAAMAASVLAGAAPVPVIKSTPSDVGDGDVDSEEEDIFHGIEEEFATGTKKPAAASPGEAPPAAPVPTPAATPTPPLAAQVVPPAVAPLAAQVPPAGEPAKATTPVQPAESWVPPNLFEAPAAPVVPPPQVAAATPQAPAVQPAAQASQPAQPDRTQVREQYLGELTRYYTPKEEEARALMLEPERVIPQMFARAHVDVLDAVISGISQELPRMVQMTVNRMIGEAKVSRQFYQSWPQLAKTEFTPVVQRLMQVYQGQFPGADPDQLVRDVGAAAMVHLRLPLPGMPSAATSPAAPPMQPPIAPANPGAGTGGPTGRQRGLFENLQDEWTTEERLEEL